MAKTKAQMIAKYNAKRRVQLQLDFIPAKIQLTLFCMECLEVRVNIHCLTDKELNILSFLNMKYPQTNTTLKYTFGGKEYTLFCKELFEYLNYKFFGPRIDAIKEVLGVEPGILLNGHKLFVINEENSDFLRFSPEKCYNIVYSTICNNCMHKN